MGTGDGDARYVLRQELLEDWLIFPPATSDKFSLQRDFRPNEGSSHGSRVPNWALLALELPAGSG